MASYGKLSFVKDTKYSAELYIHYIIHRKAKRLWYSDLVLDSRELYI